MGNEPRGGRGQGDWGAVYRTLLRLVVVVLFAYGIHRLIGWVTTQEMLDSQQFHIGMLATLVLAYALVIAVPFVPGIEIGLSLMLMEGPWIAPLVYVSTVAGLSLAYAVGEWVPYAALRRVLEDLRLGRACQLLEAARPLTRAERLEALRKRVPAWLRPVAVRYRYVLLATLVNVPGNAVLGGGGGILFTAGLSRLFMPVLVVLTILVAVAPVPLAVWLFDIDLGAVID